MAKSFVQNLLFRYFCLWNAISFALFFFWRKTGNIFYERFALNEILVLRNFFAQFAQNRKFYAKCYFLGKLSKIEILSLELNNWRCIPYIKKILTYEYDKSGFFRHRLLSCIILYEIKKISEIWLKKFKDIIHTWLGKAFKGHLKLFNRIKICQVSHSQI